MQIYTIGYGTSRTVPTLIEQLKKRGIQTLIDCRTNPYSKFNPKFCRNDLKTELEAEGITYTHNRALGGKQEFGEEYAEAVADLIKQAGEEHPPIALMCSELDPRACHRFQKIGEDLSKKRIIVIHIDKNDEDWGHPTKRSAESQYPLFEIGENP